MYLGSLLSGCEGILKSDKRTTIKASIISKIWSSVDYITIAYFL